jgi:XTP/dITP diphosphohydrolase
MKKIEKILIATGNQGKFNEISQLLKPLNISAISTADFSLAEPEEYGKTFQENSLIKARYYGSQTNLIALADDSGLCVDALNGKPGIKSARFAFDEKLQKSNFPLAFEKIFFELAEIGITPEKKPSAYFICNLSLFNPKTNFEISFEGRVDGHLIYPPRGNKGFGYDPIFVKDDMDISFGEIAASEKDLISHRGNAFKKFVAWLEKQNA